MHNENFDLQKTEARVPAVTVERLLVTSLRLGAALQTTFPVAEIAGAKKKAGNHAE